MAEVFISYAREDQGFARDIHAALQKVNRDTWIDWRSIPDSAKWRAEIFAAIEAADNFLFVISPDSVKSWMCGQEVTHAVANNKRLITILYHPVERKKVIPALAEIQWIDYPNLGFEETFKRLIKALDTNFDWEHKHTQFLVRATGWDANNRDEGFLLHGMELEGAVHWLDQAAAIEDRRPTEFQEQYIRASEEWEAGIQRLKDLIEAMDQIKSLPRKTKRLFGETRKADEKERQWPRVYEQASITVVDKLKIDGFIDKNWEEIEKRVLDVEKRVADMGQVANVVFVAECLPFVAQIVHVGSTLDNFRTAKDWVAAVLPNVDAVSVLAALTFLYIVVEGKELAEADPEELKLWQSIQCRVDSYLEPEKTLYAKPPVRQHTEEQASIAVVGQLQINGYIDENWEEIEKRLLDAEFRLADMGQGANVVFVAECLPFVAAIVHRGSTLDRFRHAKHWVSAEIPNADAVSVLSALTFFYIVQKGKGLAEADPEKVKVWESIQCRVNRLLERPKSPTAV